MTSDDARPGEAGATQWWLLAAVAAVPPAGLAVVWGGTEAADRDLLLAHLLYWLMPCVAAFAVVCGWRRLRAARPLAQQVADWWPALLSAVALTAAVFWLVEPELRMQLDETHLVSASQNMHLRRMAVITTAGLPGADGVTALELTVDKRPPLFAFCVSLLHDVTGYRIANAYWWNGALLALALALVFRAVRARLGVTAALGGQLLLLAVPLTAVVATSAGFELMASALLMLVVLAALDFHRQPDDARFTGLLGAGLLFAHARYESLPAAALLLVAIAWSVRGRFRPTRGACTLLAFVPALVTPLVLLMLHARNPKFYPEANGAPLVGLEHLFAHVGPFFAWFFEPASLGVSPGALALVAALALVVRWLRREGAALDLFAGLPVCAITGVALLWFYGDAGERTALRLFLPISWLAALLPLALVRSFPRAGFGVLLVALGLAAWRVPRVAAGEIYPTHRYTTVVRQLERMMATLSFDEDQALWIGVPAPYLLVTGRAAVTVRSFQRSARLIDQGLRERTLGAMFVVTTPFDAQMAPVHGDPRELLQRIPSELVAEASEPQRLRVYRLRP